MTTTITPKTDWLQYRIRNSYCCERCHHDVEELFEYRIAQTEYTLDVCAECEEELYHEED
jgi:hypothetical protein